MDIMRNPEVLHCLMANNDIREANQRNPNNQRPIPAEIELMHFMDDELERQLAIYKKEVGGDVDNSILDWLNGRELDEIALDRLAEMVPYEACQIVATTIDLVYVGAYRLEATSLDPLKLRWRNALID